MRRPPWADKIMEFLRTNGPKRRKAGGGLAGMLDGCHLRVGSQREMSWTADCCGSGDRMDAARETGLSNDTCPLCADWQARPFEDWES